MLSLLMNLPASLSVNIMKNRIVLADDLESQHHKYQVTIHVQEHLQCNQLLKHKHVDWFLYLRSG